MIEIMVPQSRAPDARAFMIRGDPIEGLDPLLRWTARSRAAGKQNPNQ